MAATTAWYLVLLLTSGPANGTYALSQPYPSQDACQKAGTANATDHLLQKDGEGGADIAGFICVHH